MDGYATLAEVEDEFPADRYRVGVFKWGEKYSDPPLSYESGGITAKGLCFGLSGVAEIDFDGETFLVVPGSRHELPGGEYRLRKLEPSELVIAYVWELPWTR